MLQLLQESLPPETDHRDLILWTGCPNGTLLLGQLLVRTVTSTRSSEEYKSLIADLSDAMNHTDDVLLRIIEIAISIEKIGKVEDRLKAKVMTIITK